MQSDIQSFLAGLSDCLVFQKYAEQSVDGGIFPALTQQAKWRYARYPEMLQLTDDQNVYGFKTPKDIPENGEFPLELLKNIPLQNFGEGAEEAGLAQIHRSSPESLYFTLQEGQKNPTYTFSRKDGSWKGVSKKRLKKAIKALVEANPQIDPAAVVEGLKTGMEKAGAIDWGNLGQNLTSIPTQNAFNLAMRLSTMPGRSPLMSTLAGAGAGGLYDLLRREYYNTPEENEQETWGNRALRYALPAAALGGYGLLLNPIDGPAVDERFPIHSFKPVLT